MSQSYQCPSCTKEFKRKHNLTDHFYYVHSDMKKFSCPDCNKAFKYCRTLKTHICPKFYTTANNQIVSSTNDFSHKDTAVFPNVDNFKFLAPTSSFNPSKVALFDTIESQPRLTESISTSKANVTMTLNQLTESNSKVIENICTNSEILPENASVNQQMQRDSSRVNRISKKPQSYPCPSCTKEFKRKHNLTDHFYYVHSDMKKFSCPDCNKAFKYSCALKKHICPKFHTIELSTNDKKPQSYPCPSCTKEFKRKTQLTSHLYYKHSDMKKFSCLDCNEAFKYHYTLKEHICPKVVDNICSKSEISLENLSINQQMQRDSSRVNPISKKPQSYPCPSCTKEFKRKPHLTDHLYYKHSDMKKFSCLYCNEAFKYRINLRKHICPKFHTTANNQLLLSDESNSSHKDTICTNSEILPENASVNQKIQRNSSVVNPISKKPQNLNTYSCLTCGRHFKNKGHLKDHMATHSDQRPFKCRHCNSAFKSNNVLKKHLELKCERLEGAEKYKCTLCDRSYKDKYYLKRHENIHLKNPNFTKSKLPESYPCPSCTKEFKRKPNLTDHLYYVHSDMKKFSCLDCNEAFKYRSTLKKHICPKFHTTANNQLLLSDESNSSHKDTVVLLDVDNFKIEAPASFNPSKVALFDSQLQLTKLESISTSKADVTMSGSNSKVMDNICNNSEISAENSSVNQKIQRNSSVVNPTSKKPKKLIPYSCLTCGRCFKNKSHMKDHMTTHSDQRPFKCKHCNSDFKLSTHLEKHLLKCEKARDTQLSVAVNQPAPSDKSDLNDDTETLPQNVRMAEGYTCCVCQAIFETSDLLVDHTLASHPVKDHLCELCALSFYTVKDLCTHKILIHSADSNGTVSSTTTNPVKKIKGKYTCKICHRNYRKKWPLITHMYSAHSNLKPFECKRCGLAFRANRTLKKHFCPVPSDEPPYKCPYLCLKKKQFDCKHDLLEHMRYVHFQVVKFTCQKCGESFKFKQSLQVHACQEMLENDETPMSHKCPLCEKILKSRQGLKEHLKIVHLNIKPVIHSQSKISLVYPCPTCAKEFKQKSHLKEHLHYVHSDVKKFSCPDCKEAFKYRLSLKRHLNKCKTLMQKMKSSIDKHGPLCNEDPKLDVTVSDNTVKYIYLNNTGNLSPNNQLVQNDDCNFNHNEEDISQSDDFNEHTSPTLSSNLKFSDKSLERNPSHKNPDKNASQLLTPDYSYIPSPFLNYSSGNWEKTSEPKQKISCEQAFHQCQEDVKPFHEDKLQSFPSKQQQQEGLPLSTTAKETCITDTKVEEILDFFHNNNEDNEVLQSADSFQLDALTSYLSKAAFLNNIESQVPLAEFFSSSKVDNIITDNQFSESTDGQFNNPEILYQNESIDEHILSDSCDSNHSDKKIWKSTGKTVHNSPISGPNPTRYSCLMCPKQFGRKSHLKEHVNYVHLKVIKFTCQRCGKGFKYKQSFKVHSCGEMLKNDETPKTHKCPLCGKILKRSHHLKEHITLVHLKVIKFTCQRCGEGFRYKRNFRTHYCQEMLENCEETSVSHKCPLCWKIFKHNHRLKEHLELVHLKVIKFACRRCGKGFKYKRSYQLHACREIMLAKNDDLPIFRSSDVTPYECDECPKRFRRKHHLVEHGYVHSDEKRYSCPDCKEFFKYRSTRKKHRCPKSNDGLQRQQPPSSYPCPKCPKVFKAKRALYSHKYTHDPYKWLCKICAKRFNVRSAFVDHERYAHSDAKPFSCQRCGKSYKRKRDATRHKCPESLSENKDDISARHPCPLCDQTFKYKFSVGGHVKSIHMGLKPYVCEKCGAAYKYSQSLLKKHKCRSGEGTSTTRKTEGEKKSYHPVESSGSEDANARRVARRSKRTK